MPQTAILFPNARTSAKGYPVALWASPQGLPMSVGKPGNTYFVDETNGNDTQAGVGGPYTPYKTLATAVALMVDGDLLFITGTAHVSATLTFSKNNCRIIGLNSPSNNNRARISQTGSTVFSPLVDVTGQGNRFENFATFHGFADASAQICWKDEGGRNGYEGVQFFGGGNATAAAHAGMRSLLLSGSTGENEFNNCVIGLDTVLRATGNNASLEIAGGSPRNSFSNTKFRSWCSDAADVHVLIGSGGIDRVLNMDNCTFHNFTGGGGTSLTADFSVHASAGGDVMVNGGMSVGAGKISAAGPVYVNGAVPTAGTSSIGVLAS